MVKKQHMKTSAAAVEAAATKQQSL